MEKYSNLINAGILLNPGQDLRIKALLNRSVGVWDFPHDVREREIANLLRFFDGFVAYQRRQLRVVAIFVDSTAAETAALKLNGMPFHSEKYYVVLRSELPCALLDNVSGPSTFDNQSVVPLCCSRPLVKKIPGAPCDTLCIDNLDTHTSESHLNLLRERISPEPGYRYMDTQHGPQNIICFIVFDNVQNATEAGIKLQGVGCGHIPVDIKYRD